MYTKNALCVLCNYANEIKPFAYLRAERHRRHLYMLSSIERNGKKHLGLLFLKSIDILK
jgi:hypothetical protein